MKQPKSLYQQWYPNTYQLKPYPLEGRKALTVKNRQEIYQRLMKPQRSLVEKYKKYQMRSFFLNQHYLLDTQWVFETLNIDENYNRKLKRYHLHCHCGKAIKYQFILKSKKTDETIALGITHFADHLGISQEVANEIKKGVNKVDLALDELLWLKDRGYVFPEDLWKQFLFALYRNQEVLQPYAYNQVLVDRLLEFRKCQMPIFIADYLAVLNEIRAIEDRVKEEPTVRLTDNQQQFENYYETFEQLAKQPAVVVPKYHLKSYELYEQWQNMPAEERAIIFDGFQKLVEASQS